MFSRAKDRRAAVDEAVRFLERMEELEKALKATNSGSDWVYSNPVETGAVRRSSMDLTRALAKLRKYGE